VKALDLTCSPRCLLCPAASPLRCWKIRGRTRRCPRTPPSPRSRSCRRRRNASFSSQCDAFLPFSFSISRSLSFSDASTISPSAPSLPSIQDDAAAAHCLASPSLFSRLLLCVRNVRSLRTLSTKQILGYITFEQHRRYATSTSRSRGAVFEFCRMPMHEDVYFFMRRTEVFKIQCYVFANQELVMRVTARKSGASS
jgi:hypothetical protein